MKHSNPSRTTHSILIRASLLLALLPGFFAPPVARADEPIPSAPTAAAFADPPLEARPRVYWWWLNSMATKASITRDLDELKAKGYAGVNLFDAGSSSYQGMDRTPAGPVFGSPAWIELFVHALKEADRLGLEVTTNVCSGWNPGGPCVTADDAMKHLIYTETRIAGPARFSAILQAPRAAEGYHDITVQAFRLRGAAPAAQVEKPSVSASSEQDVHPAASILAPAAARGESPFWVSEVGPTAAKPQWLQLTYTKPVKLSSFHVAGRSGYHPREFELQLSEDGKTFKSAGTFNLTARRPSGEFKIAPATARVLRLLITAGYDRNQTAAAPRNVQVSAFGPGPLASRAAAPGAGLDHWAEKSLTRIFGSVGNGLDADDNTAFLGQHESADPASAEIEPDSVIDLTAKMDAAGKLTWEAPAGNWLVVRYGYAPLPSAKVSTASEGWGGYSFDHLNSDCVKRYLTTVMDPVLKAAAPYCGRSLKYIYTDSWEMGSPTWTSDFAAQFKQRRGYEIAPWLPVLAGRVVGSKDLSDRFLYDYRQTVADLIADRYYGTFGAYARAHGLGIHCEAGGPHGHPVDALRCLGQNEWMQGEFWPRCLTHRVTEAQRYFVKQPASAAHIYGKTWIAAEGPTTVGPHWQDPPRDLKDAFDKVFCEGLNRLYWHTFTSSPAEFGVPGNEYFAGTHLNPNVTWWPQAKSVIDYVARCCTMLSRGRFVADVCVFIGDDIPAFGTRKHEVEGLGAGFDYDDINAEVILTRLTVKDGLLTLPDGMSYRALILPHRDGIALPVLRKLAELVRAGATIVGPRPVTANGLIGHPESESEVQKIAGELWGKIDGKSITENRAGKGRVIFGKPLREVFAADGVGPDFAAKSSLPDSEFDFIHRQGEGCDFYYVINRYAWHDAHDFNYRYRTDLPDRYETLDATFRVAGATPELWDPLTGKITSLPVWREEGGRTTIPLRLAPYGGVFVVFRKGGAGGHITEIKKDGKTVFPVAAGKPGAWPVVEMTGNVSQAVANAFEKRKICLQE